MIESGCRYTEVVEMVINFEEKNIEVYDEKIVLYRNFYLRGKKSSYYLFMSFKTYTQLLLELENITYSLLRSFQNIISHRKDIISLKYLRKYQFTLLIKAGIDFEVANFIQGRTSQNIGFNHYLAKKEIALKEYKKIKF